MSHGTVCWSECVTRDVAATKAHYGAVCGWTFTDQPMDGFTYTMGMAGDVPVAGIMDLATLDSPGVEPHWMTYIAVDDIEAAMAASERTGGRTIRAPFDVPGVGQIAIVQEPGGAVAGLMQPVAEPG